MCSRLLRDQVLVCVELNMTPNQRFSNRRVKVLRRKVFIVFYNCKVVYRCLLKSENLKLSIIIWLESLTLKRYSCGSRRCIQKWKPIQKRLVSCFVYPIRIKIDSLGIYQQHNLHSIKPSLARSIRDTKRVDCFSTGC
jgi:hypothetical protein